MRYPHGITVIVAWFNSDGERCHSRFAFKGNVDKRRVRREIRKAMRRIGINTTTQHLNDLIRVRSYVVDAT